MKGNIHKLSVFIILLVVFISSINISFASEFSVSSGVSIDLPITVIANEFDGNTTDFSILNNSQLASLENIVLENTTFGKINFSETVDLTKVVVNSTVDLDSYIEISNNTIFINTSYFTNLAVRAELSFYQVSLTDPRILKNNDVCDAPTCNILSYDSGILIVNTTGLSSSEAVTFTIEKTPDESSKEESIGGGGGSSSSGTATFELNSNESSFYEYEGIKYLITFESINPSLGVGIVNVTGDTIEDKRYILLINRSRRIDLDGDNINDILLILEEVDSFFLLTVTEINIPSGGLFDITFSLEELVIQSGSSAVAIVTFENFGTEPTEINLTFIFLDNIGNEVYREDESLVVQTEAVLFKNFENLNFPNGNYALVLRTLYNENVEDEFIQEFEIGPERRSGITRRIIEGLGGTGNIRYIIAIIILILLIVLVWWLLVRNLKKRKEKKL